MITQDEIEKVAKGMPGSIRSPHEQDLFIQGAQWAISKQQGEVEELRRRLEIAVKALKYVGKVTYGTEVCNSDEENNEILAQHYFACASKAREALKQLNKPTSKEVDEKLDGPIRTAGRDEK